MSWNLQQKFDYANAEIYKKRVQMAFFTTANDVVNEPTNTANHAKRLALAQQVLSGAGMPPRAPQLLPILNPALQVDGGEPSDNDILFTVSQQWLFFAPELP